VAISDALPLEATSLASLSWHNHNTGSADPQCTPVSNFSEIKQTAAELLQFNHLKCGRRSPSLIWSEIDFNLSIGFEARSSILQQLYRISAQ